MENEDYKNILEAIVDTLLPRFSQSKDEMTETPENDFLCGRTQAYYEVLDVIKNRINMYGYDPSDFGLNEEALKL